MIFSLVVKHGNTFGVAEFRCLSFKGPSSTITPPKFYKQRSHQKLVFYKAAGLPFLCQDN